MFFLVYLYIFLFITVSVTLFLMGIEQVITVATRRAPAVSAGKKKTAAVVAQIKKDFPDVKTVLDIGSGWGNMVCAVAKQFPNASITGIEMMPTPYLKSLINTKFLKNIKIVFGDAFKYLDKTGKNFDIGISYLLTPEMRNVEKYLSRFKTLFSVDFPLPNIKPTNKVKIYHDGRIQHWLYIYKQK